MGPDFTGLHGVVISPMMVALDESWLAQDVHAWPRLRAEGKGLGEDLGGDRSTVVPGQGL